MSSKLNMGACRIYLRDGTWFNVLYEMFDAVIKAMHDDGAYSITAKMFDSSEVWLLKSDIVAVYRYTHEQRLQDIRSSLEIEKLEEEMKNEINPEW